MASPRLLDLIDRYVEQSCTEEERRELMSLLQAPDSDEEIRRLVDEAYARRLTNPALPEEASASILQSILQVSTPVVNLQKRNWRVPRRWVGIAALFLLFFTGAWFFFSYRRVNQPAHTALSSSVVKNDIVPGHSGAILTLANGATILLDSAQDGSLSPQGNVQVVKRNGQLSYTGSGKSSEVLYNTMTTPRGRQYQVVLADGTRVWLNSASSLHFPTAFTGPTREVQLTGEAYFEVADNAAQPFVVKTQRLDVHVLGTAFNVMAYEDEEAVRTTLVQGAVKVSARNQELQIRPGEQAALAEKDHLAVSSPDLSEVLAWKEGKFRFKKTPIKMIMRQIARWYDVDIVYKGKTPDLLLSGVFPRTEYVSQLLEVLQEAGNIHFTMEGNTITLLSSEKQGGHMDQ